MTLTLFPRLYQSKRQIDPYNLDIDAQAILVASRLMAAGVPFLSKSQFVFITQQKIPILNDMLQLF